jgi:hypothetical protein
MRNRDTLVANAPAGSLSTLPTSQYARVDLQLASRLLLRGTLRQPSIDDRSAELSRIGQGTVAEEPNDRWHVLHVGLGVIRLPVVHARLVDS